MRVFLVLCIALVGEHFDMMSENPIVIAALFVGVVMATAQDAFEVLVGRDKIWK